MTNNKKQIEILKDLKEVFEKWKITLNNTFEGDLEIECLDKEDNYYSFNFYEYCNKEKLQDKIKELESDV